MTRYLVAIHHPDGYDGSLEDEAMHRDIDALSRGIQWLWHDLQNHTGGQADDVFRVPLGNSVWSTGKAEITLGQKSAWGKRAALESRCSPEFREARLWTTSEKLPTSRELSRRLHSYPVTSKRLGSTCSCESRHSLTSVGRVSKMKRRYRSTF